MELLAIAGCSAVTDDQHQVWSSVEGKMVFEVVMSSAVVPQDPAQDLV